MPKIFNFITKISLFPAKISKNSQIQISNFGAKIFQVICENVPSMEFVQPDVFLESDPFLNALMPCKGESIINKMNLNAWATASPRFIVPDNMLLDAIERAR